MNIPPIYWPGIIIIIYGLINLIYGIYLRVTKKDWKTFKKGIKFIIYSIVVTILLHIAMSVIFIIAFSNLKLSPGQFF